MIKVYRIEEFVINEIFRPFAPSFIGRELGSEEYKRKHSSIEWTLCQNPEYIIELLEERPEVKRKVFEAINMFDGLDFYKYLDMDCPIIQYKNQKQTVIKSH